ncbi:MAG: hypothetical protein AAF529_09360 [Pseudomonadota bacterium]
MDPIEQFYADRAEARAAQDPMAAVCCIANYDGEQVQQRTLVLRDVEGELAIFINATSPKWAALLDAFSLTTWWPSVQVQYRMQGTTSLLDSNLVAESWQLRPDNPKKMDWFYHLQKPQSSRIEDRDALLNAVAALPLPEPLVAPAEAQGLQLNIANVERLDLNQSNGIHDRRVFVRQSNAWQVSTLVP